MPVSLAGQGAGSGGPLLRGRGARIDDPGQHISRLLPCCGSDGRQFACGRCGSGDGEDGHRDAALGGDAARARGRRELRVPGGRSVAPVVEDRARQGGPREAELPARTYRGRGAAGAFGGAGHQHADAGLRRLGRGLRGAGAAVGGHAGKDFGRKTAARKDARGLDRGGAAAGRLRPLPAPTICSLFVGLGQRRAVVDGHLLHDARDHGGLQPLPQHDRSDAHVVLLRLRVGRDHLGRFRGLLRPPADIRRDPRPLRLQRHPDGPHARVRRRVRVRDAPGHVLRRQRRPGFVPLPRVDPQGNGLRHVLHEHDLLVRLRGPLAPRLGDHALGAHPLRPPRLRRHLLVARVHAHPGRDQSRHARVPPLAAAAVRDAVLFRDQGRLGGGVEGSEAGGRVQPGSAGGEGGVCFRGALWRRRGEGAAESRGGGKGRRQPQLVHQGARRRQVCRRLGSGHLERRGGERSVAPHHEHPPLHLLVRLLPGRSLIQQLPCRTPDQHGPDERERYVSRPRHLHGRRHPLRRRLPVHARLAAPGARGDHLDRHALHGRLARRFRCRRLRGRQERSLSACCSRGRQPSHQRPLQRRLADLIHRPLALHARTVPHCASHAAPRPRHVPRPLLLHARPDHERRAALGGRVVPQRAAALRVRGHPGLCRWDMLRAAARDAARGGQAGLVEGGGEERDGARGGARRGDKRGGDGRCAARERCIAGERPWGAAIG